MNKAILILACFLVGCDSSESTTYTAQPKDGIVITQPDKPAPPVEIAPPIIQPPVIVPPVELPAPPLPELPPVKTYKLTPENVTLNEIKPEYIGAVTGLVDKNNGRLHIDVTGILSEIGYSFTASNKYAVRLCYQLGDYSFAQKHYRGNVEYGDLVQGSCYDSVMNGETKESIDAMYGDMDVTGLYFEFMRSGTSFTVNL